MLAIYLSYIVEAGSLLSVTLKSSKRGNIWNILIPNYPLV